MLLYDQLFDPFDHRSRLNAITNVVSAVVIAVTVDPPLRCSSDSSIAFNVIGVSSWFFLCLLFHCFRFCFADVAPPSRHVRHGRCRAHFVPQSLQLRTSVDARSRGEHVGAFAFAVGLTIDELAPVSASSSWSNAGG